MVKITNEGGEIKVGKQGLAVYQRHYGHQMRRTLSKKSGISSKPQIQQRQRFREALAWRATLTKEAKIFLDGWAISHGVIDGYGIPLTWDKFALKIALETPELRVFY